MINVLYSTSCTSCRKTVEFFEKNHIVINKINIMTDEFDSQMFKDILTLTENGFNDIISSRSKILLERKVKLDNMHTNDVIKLIMKEPTILKRPIIIQYTEGGTPYRLLVGYNAEDILIFLRDKKKYDTYTFKTNHTCECKVCDSNDELYHKQKEKK